MPSPVHKHTAVHSWMIVFICLILAIQPAAVLAAPAAQLGDPVPYADPNGLFSLDYPDSLVQQQTLTFEDVAERPLDGLLANTGYYIADPDGNVILVALFLLLDQPIEDVDALTAFVEQFQSAAGGEILPQVEIEVTDEDGLYALGVTVTDEALLLIGLEPAGDVAAVVTLRVDPETWDAESDALGEMLDSFDWFEDAVRSFLSARPEQRVAPKALSAVKAALARTQSLPEMSRYTDPDGVFALSVPADLEGRLEDPGPGGYGYGFYAPGEENVTDFVVAVSLITVGNLLDTTAEDLQLYPIDDDQWETFTDDLTQGINDLEILSDIRNPVEHTGYLVLDSGPIDEAGNSQRIWMWYEEADGILAMVSSTGQVSADGDDQGRGKIFHAALSSFGWSPTAAASSIAQISGAPDPAEAPIVFDDPLGLLEASVPAAYPFQSATFDGDEVSYRFGTTPDAGVVTLNLSSPKASGYSDDEWQQIVSITQGSAVDTMAENSLGEAELTLSEIGTPAVETGHSALLRAQSSTYQQAVLLRELDGVLAVQVMIVPDDRWQANAAAFEGALENPIQFDPTTVRDGLAAYADLGVTVLGTTMVSGRPIDEQALVPQFDFAREETVTTAIAFAESELAGEVDVVLSPADKDSAFALFDIDVSDEATTDTDDIIVKQNDEGSKVAAVYTPDFKITPGAYTARVYYQGVPLAAHGFRVTGTDPDAPKLASLMMYAGDPEAYAPAPATARILPDEPLYLRGTGEWPADSQMRLFWFDPAGSLLADATQTIRLEAPGEAWFDWFYFRPEVQWQPGVYGWLLTLNGEELASGDLTVLEPMAAAELDEEGAALLAGIPVPPDLIVTSAMNGVDLAIETTIEFPTDEVLDTVTSYLRIQGWQRTLPFFAAPLDYRFQRWSKDGYQLVIEPGSGDAATQLWLTYAPIASADMDSAALALVGAPPPSGLPITPETLSDVQEVALAGLVGDTVSAAAVSPDGNWLALTGDDQGTLALFDAHTLQLHQFWRPDSGIYGEPVFSPDSTILAAVVQDDNRSQIQLFENFEVVWLPTTILAGHTDDVTALVSDSNATQLHSASLDATVRSWTVGGDSVRLPRVWRAGVPLSGLAETPEGEPGLLTGLDSGQILLQDPDGALKWAGQQVAAMAPRLAVSPLLSEDGVGEVVVYGDGAAEWFGYNANAAAFYSALPPDEPEFAASSAAISPDGSLTLVAGPRIIFYESASGDYLDTIQPQDEQGQNLAVRAMNFSPDGHYLLVVTSDGSLRVWAVTTP